MILKVIKKFNGKVEGKALNVGDTITTDDVNRINVLVGRGLCVITSITNPRKDKAETASKTSGKGAKKEKAETDSEQGEKTEE